MDLALVLVVVGLLIALFVHGGVGLACIIVGLVLLLWPRYRGRERI